MTEPVDTIPVQLTIHVPKQLTLTVQTSLDGALWPAAGVANTRFISAQALLDAGIDVRWILSDGTPMPTDTALALLAQHQAELDSGNEPPVFITPGATAL